MCVNSWWRQWEFWLRAARGLRIPLERKQGLGFDYPELNCFLHEDSPGSPPWFQGGGTALGSITGSVLPSADSQIQRVNLRSNFDQSFTLEGHKPFPKLGWVGQAPFAKKTNKTNNPNTGGSFLNFKTFHSKVFSKERGWLSRRCFWNEPFGGFIEKPDSRKKKKKVTVKWNTAFQIKHHVLGWLTISGFVFSGLSLCWFETKWIAPFPCPSPQVSERGHGTKHLSSTEVAIIHCRTWLARNLKE